MNVERDNQVMYCEQRGNKNALSYLLTIASGKEK